MLINRLGNGSAQHVPVETGIATGAHRHVGSQSLFNYLSKKLGLSGSRWDTLELVDRPDSLVVHGGNLEWLAPLERGAAIACDTNLGH